MGSRSDAVASQNACVEAEAYTSSSTSMADLCYSLLATILSGLPFDTLLQCRLVCKAWRALLSDPFFTRIRCQRAGVVDVLIFKPGSVNSVHVAELCEQPEDPLNPQLARPYKTKFKPPSSVLQVVGFCNGLVCFSDSVCLAIFVCNPVSGECVMLPQPKSPLSVRSYVFGFCPASRTYKVLNFGEASSDVEILSVGTGEWRCIGKAGRPVLQSPSAVILNGAPHWVTEDAACPELISSFNMVAEQFCAVSAPVELRGKVKLRGDGFGEKLKLGVLENTVLCIFDNSSSSHLDLWSMREYGVAESWSRQRISKTPNPLIPRPLLLPVQGRGQFVVNPFGVWSDEEILKRDIHCLWPLASMGHPKDTNFQDFEILGLHSDYLVALTFSGILSLMDDAVVPTQ